MEQHPDVSAARFSGGALWQYWENRDTPENRDEFIEEHSERLLDWLREEEPDVLDQFLRRHLALYRSWLN